MSKTENIGQGPKACTSAESASGGRAREEVSPSRGGGGVGGPPPRKF